NDILYNDKKFSGNAYYKTKYGSCLHGTILYNTDIERLVKSITPSDEKLISKGIKSVKSRVMNMADVVGLDIEAFTSVVIDDICDGAYYLNSDQLQRISVYQKQYESNDFVYKKNPPYTYEYKKRFECGTVGIKIDVNKNIIKDVVIFGDFFSKNPIEQVSSRLIGLDYTKLDVNDVFKEIEISEYIIGLKNLMFYQLFMGGKKPNEENSLI
ncbi:MAG TPA: lipoate protein ligase C-terminal domain-containing protein, partial [Acholeplasma sp.]|nr:lipoate protein ligase C-terminal domain-containing protein [Acholeplasma sp.]